MSENNSVGEHPLGRELDAVALLRRKNAATFKKHGYRAYSDAFNHVIVNHNSKEYGLDLACAVQLRNDLDIAISEAAMSDDRLKRQSV